MTSEATQITGAETIGAMAHAPVRVTIDADASPLDIDWREAWAYRELLYILVWRDIKVRYKQTLMGAAWVIVQPLLTMLLFTFIFSKLQSVPAANVPYPLLAYSGLLLWMFFANAVTSATHSLIGNANLVTKVYFPRFFIPAAAVAAGLLDLAVASTILVALLIYYGIGLTWSVLLLPIFVVLMALFALAAGLVVSAVTVKFRDLRHAIPFMLQVMMLASPVVYPSSIVEGKWRALFALNPASGIIEGFRAALFGGTFDVLLTTTAITLTLALLVASIYIFRRIEETFADLI